MKTIILNLPPGPFYSCQSESGDTSCASEYSFDAEDLKWCPSIHKWICMNCEDGEAEAYGFENPDKEWIEPTQTLHEYLVIHAFLNSL